MKTHETYDPYELMIIPPNKKTKMIIQEIEKFEYKPNLNLVRDLITLGANVDWQDEEYNMTALHWAAYYNRIKIVKILIDAGADLDVRNNMGYTALHRAAYYNRIKIVRMLINAGANVNVQDYEGCTLLHDLAFWRNIKTVKILIAAGARKDIQNKQGRIPYDLADTEELKNLLRL